MASGKHEILVPGSSRQTVTFYWLEGAGVRQRRVSSCGRAAV